MNARLAIAMNTRKSRRWATSHPPLASRRVLQVRNRGQTRILNAYQAHTHRKKLGLRRRFTLLSRYKRTKPAYPLPSNPHSC